MSRSMRGRGFVSTASSCVMALRWAFRPFPQPSGAASANHLMSSRISKQNIYVATPFSSISGLPARPRYQRIGDAVYRSGWGRIVAVYIVARRAAFSPGFRYGENSGDSRHAEPHARTSCHYQILLLNPLLSEVRLKRKDFPEAVRLPWAQEVPSSNLGAPTIHSRVIHPIFAVLRQGWEVALVTRIAPS